MVDVKCLLPATTSLPRLHLQFQYHGLPHHRFLTSHLTSLGHDLPKSEFSVVSFIALMIIVVYKTSTICATLCDLRLGSYCEADVL